MDNNTRSQREKAAAASKLFNMAFEGSNVRNPEEFANQDDYKAHVAETVVTTAGVTAKPISGDTQESLSGWQTRFSSRSTLPPVEDDPEYTAHYRIEALRAASRITAALGSNQVITATSDDLEYIDSATIRLAEQFDRWLETGERHEQT